MLDEGAEISSIPMKQSIRPLEKSMEICPIAGLYA